MKQIIVLANDRSKYEKALSFRDLYVTWCPFSVEELIRIRERSNVILICMDHEKYNDLNRMGLYLRDMCIEDEKSLYLYGNKDDVNTIASLVPSLFIKKTLYSFAGIEKIVNDIVAGEVIRENGKPIFLMIDDDREYVEKLRVYLDPFYQVFVSRFDHEEIENLIMMADRVLISVNGNMRLLDFIQLYQTLLSKKKVPGFTYYHIADTDWEKAIVDRGSGQNNMAFSKETDVQKVADYLIKHRE